MRSLQKDTGFTLIEVLITVMILGTLTVLAARSMQQAVQSKTKIQGQIDDLSKIRDTLRVFERDLNLAYHHRDIEKEMDTLIKKYQRGTSTQRPPGAPGAPAAPGTIPGSGLPGEGNPEDPYANLPDPNRAPRQDPTTHFVGTENAIHLVTRNNSRMVANQKEADFSEVSYSLKDCKSLKEGEGTSKCLWRRHHSFVDDDVTLGGTEVVLLENVTEFELKYLGKGKQDWVTTWRSDKAGDAVTKGHFPIAVELSLTVEKKEKGKAKKYSMQIVAPIHFPNNPVPSATQGGTNANPQ